MRWLRQLRQRLRCLNYAGACAFCQAWKASTAMPERHPLDVPGRKYPGKNPD